MKPLAPFAFFALASLGACGNLGGNLTPELHAKMCTQYGQYGQLDDAESECTMALVTADLSNNPKLKSQRLFNLGLIKQQLSKFSEAEVLFRESLQIEVRLSSPAKVVGGRLIELSANLAAQGKWSEGTQILEPLLPIAPQFSKPVRARIAHLLMQYNHHLMLTNQAALAKRFKNTATLLTDNNTYIFR